MADLHSMLSCSPAASRTSATSRSAPADGSSTRCPLWDIASPAEPDASLLAFLRTTDRTWSGRRCTARAVRTARFARCSSSPASRSSARGRTPRGSPGRSPPRRHSSRAPASRPPPPSRCRRRSSASSAPTACSRRDRGLGSALVVKPAQGGSAQGVTIVEDVAELPRALVDAFTYADDALIEQRIVGTEIAVGVIDAATDRRRCRPSRSCRAAGSTASRRGTTPARRGSTPARVITRGGAAAARRAARPPLDGAAPPLPRRPDRRRGRRRGSSSRTSCRGSPRRRMIHRPSRRRGMIADGCTRRLLKRRSATDA